MTLLEGVLRSLLFTFFLEVSPTLYLRVNLIENENKSCSF